MNDSDLHKYIASFDELLDNYDGNLYNIQEKYIRDKIDTTKITFNPIQFLAANAKEILPKCSKSGILHIFNKKYKIFFDSKITTLSEDNITNLFIESRLQKKKWKKNGFDAEAYMSQHYYLIKEYFYKEPSISYRAERFYVEYGFFNNIKLEPINGLLYLASLNNTDDSVIPLIDNLHKVLDMYFSCDKKDIITFKPYLYIVSNYSKLKQ